MISIIAGSFIISLLHAIIPNHWLPVIAIGRKQHWTVKEVSNVTVICALAHGVSTILIGAVLSLLGARLGSSVANFTSIIAPTILILLGILFIYRHHRHKHFHLNQKVQQESKAAIITALVIAMFFSPCMEIEAYFLLAGTQSAWLFWFIALLYLIITTTGMVLLVRYAYKGLLRLNWHSLEHNAGIITGITLVATGIITFFIQ